jgi:hypothetical protein
MWIQVLVISANFEHTSSGIGHLHVDSGSGTQVLEHFRPRYSGTSSMWIQVLVI